MEEKVSSLESLLERAEEYGKTSLELIKLKTLDKTADAVSSFVPQLAITLAVLVFLLMINIGIALWLGEILGKSWYGFLILAGFYLIIGIVLFLLRKWLKKLVANIIIKQTLN
jgi:hypothetical protein